MVATAASATVTEAGLSVQTAEMKVQCIDQLDKADAPLTLEAYEYLVSSTSCVVFVAKFWNLL
ncbi:hypothetical protein BGY98DRAFT_1052896, partial [Russula aff. rugulosa BPL654]